MQKSHGTTNKEEKWKYIWDYKVGINAIIVNFVCLWEPPTGENLGVFLSEPKNWYFLFCNIIQV